MLCTPLTFSVISESVVGAQSHANPVLSAVQRIHQYLAVRLGSLPSSEDIALHTTELLS